MTADGPGDSQRRAWPPEPGERVHAIFLCTRKKLERDRDGRAFLSASLRCGAQTIEGRTSYRAQLRAGGFERDDVVEVMARVDLHADRPYLVLDSIMRTNGVAPQELLPPGVADVRRLEDYLRDIVHEQVADPAYHGMLETLLVDDALRDAWRVMPCTLSGHHAWRGGLLEHTVAAAILAAQTCDLHRHLERSLVVTGAVVHDLGCTERPAPWRGEKAWGAHVGRGLRIVAALGGELPASKRHALEACVRAALMPGARPSREAAALRGIDRLDESIGWLPGRQ